MPSKSPSKDGGPPGDGLSRPLPPGLGPNKAKTNATPKKKTSLASANKSTNAKVSPDKVMKTPSKTPFRHPWMKKVNSKGQPFDGKIEENDADETMGITPEESNQGNAKATLNGQPLTLLPLDSDDPFSTGDKLCDPVTPSQAIDEDDLEADDLDENGDRQLIFMDENGLVGPYHPSVKQSMNSMEKSRRKMKSEVQDPNGRVIGRSLVLWHRKISFDFLLGQNAARNLRLTFL